MQWHKNKSPRLIPNQYNIKRPNRKKKTKNQNNNKKKITKTKIKESNHYKYP
jgi:hypothetical protein